MLPCQMSNAAFFLLYATHPLVSRASSLLVVPAAANRALLTPASVILNSQHGFALFRQPLWIRLPLKPTYMRYSTRVLHWSPH